MEPSDFDAIFVALKAAKVRYLVVGGVAVVLHGVPRFTADLDLVIALDEPNVRAAMAGLAALGYRPRAPVPAEQFADAVTRRSWIDDKGLTVFSLWSPDHPATDIDLFVEEPFPFDEAYRRAVRADLGTTVISVVFDRRFDRSEATCRSAEGPGRYRSAPSARTGLAVTGPPGFAIHEREQRRAWQRLTPAQRLAWLWQAKLFARRALGKARTPRPK